MTVLHVFQLVLLAITLRGFLNLWRHFERFVKLRQNVTEGMGSQFYRKLRDVIYRGALPVLCIRQVLARQLRYSHSGNAFTDHPDGEHSPSHSETIIQHAACQRISHKTASHQQPQCSLADGGVSSQQATAAMTAKPDEYIGWSDVTYLWSQCDRHFVSQHVVLCVEKWWKFVALFE